MKLDACDLCFTTEQKLVVAEVKRLRVDDADGVVDLCPSHLAELAGLLSEFFEVSRVASAESIKRCPSCPYTSVSQGEMNKHIRKHELANNRQRDLSAIPAALAAAG